MAKKKTAETANIKAAPVLRSGGDDPTPETPVITKSYCVRDDWKDINKVNYVAFKSVDGEVQDLTVNGEPAGGGGGGDFSTAEVTIDNSNNSKVYPEIYGSTAGQVNVGGKPPTYEYSSRPDIFPSDAVQTYTVILYKGRAVLQIIPDSSGIEYNVTTSGNITATYDKYIVTGDGTIAIS